MIDKVKPPKFTSQDFKDSVPFFRAELSRREACEWTAVFVNGETIHRLKAIIADDSLASRFQTVEQYRNEILNILNCDDAEMMKKPYKDYARAWHYPEER